MTAPVEIAGDLLLGAGAIALHLYGDAGARRKIYHLAATSRLPVFRLGSQLAARRSIIESWVAAQEQRAAQGRI